MSEEVEFEFDEGEVADGGGPVEQHIHRCTVRVPFTGSEGPQRAEYVMRALLVDTELRPDMVNHECHCWGALDFTVSSLVC